MKKTLKLLIGNFNANIHNYCTLSLVNFILDAKLLYNLKYKIERIFDFKFNVGCNTFICTSSGFHAERKNIVRLHELKVIKMGY